MKTELWREDMKRRLTAILLSFCMVLTMTPAIVFADGMDVEKIGITKENLSVSVYSELYTGEPIEPEAYVEFWTEGDYKELTEGVDYTIKFKGNGIDPDTGLPQEIGWYDVVITGKGNYSGTVEYNGRFEIMDPMSIGNADIDFDDEYMYTGKPVVITGLSVIGANGEELAEGEDYELLFFDYNYNQLAGAPADLGSYRLEIKGMGDYNGSCTFLFEIYASNNLHFAELTLKSCAYKYTGAGVNLDLTVQLGGETLTEGTDYTISYYDENYDQTETTPTEPGIYEAYVEGMDPSYTGSSEDSLWFIIYSDKEVEFTIPFEITVEKGGAAEPPEHLFEMDYYWWPGVDTDTEEMLELISVEGNSFTLSGAGTYENEITYKGSPEILRYIFDDNEIRLADKQESGWDYSSDTYYITLEETADGDDIKLKLFSDDYDVPVDKCVFTATYTADASTEDPGTGTDDPVGPADKPDGEAKDGGSAKTGDDMDLLLFAGMLVHAAAGAVTAGVYAGRKNTEK